MKVAAVIPAAGYGSRMKAALSKQYLPIDGKPVLYYTLSVFERCQFVDEIIVVLSNEDRELAEEKVFSRHSFRKVSSIVPGGPERRDSVYNGLRAVAPGTDFVIIHDGCRPFVTEELIKESLSAAYETGGAVVAIPLRDTLKKTNEGMIEKTVSRAGLFQAQTPQTFQFELLFKAYQTALKKEISVTDDAMLVEQMGHPVKIVPGSIFNIKITLPEDLILADLIQKYQQNMQS